MCSFFVLNRSNEDFVVLRYDWYIVWASFYNVPACFFPLEFKYANFLFSKIAPFSDEFPKNGCYNQLLLIKWV